MSVLDILIIPDKRLKYKSTNVEAFDEDLKSIVKNMFDTLAASGNGIGLAAPQVGINKRIVVIDLKEDGKSNPMTLVNPKILSSSPECLINEEGCLSIPGYYADVKRPSEIEVEWYDLKGNKKKKKCSGLLSVCIQHEIDHLDGILFIDHLSAMKRKMAVQKIKKSKKNTSRNE